MTRRPPSRKNGRPIKRDTAWPSGTHAYPCGLGHVYIPHMMCGDECIAPSLATDTLLCSGIRLAYDLHARCTGPALAIAGGARKADWPCYTAFCMECAALEAELIAMVAEDRVD